MVNVFSVVLLAVCDPFFPLLAVRSGSNFEAGSRPFSQSFSVLHTAAEPWPVPGETGVGSSTHGEASEASEFCMDALHQYDLMLRSVMIAESYMHLS